MDVVEEGIDLFASAVERRGGSVSRVPGPKALLDVSDEFGQMVRVKIRSKKRGTWHARKSDSNRSLDQSGATAWVFVDLKTRSVDFPIVPAAWMAHHIAELREQWIASDPARDPEQNDHHAVRPEHIADWCGRWDLLGLEQDRTGKLITPGRLGAWVLKCNPKTWDIKTFFDHGNRTIEGWTVAANYRTDMFEYGQRVLFWVTGSRQNAGIARGFWGSGWVLGPAEPFDGTDEGLWLDDRARNRAEFIVPTAITLFERPVESNDLARVSGLDSIEVEQIPQGANPSWVSKRELALLDSLLPEWPEWPDLDDEAVKSVTVSSEGTGFGDPESNRIVERAAMDVVTAHFERTGYLVTDVSQQHLGWDLTCSAPGTDAMRVEVKGISGSRQIVLLTRNEIRSAREDENWRLAIVTRALSSPRLQIYDAGSALEFAEPFVYRAEFPS